ncbi:MAG: hypothetical protein LBD59_11165 [Prevotellaceae bacterium]|jgi:hypothetical protein|nr:hypothetical protein [Prevotellaceae bacterium]
MKDYSMYRFFKGESENPFDKERQNTAFMFWFYENHFEDDFSEKESSDWYAFFGSNSKIGKKFMELLSTEDYERPTENKKAAIFDIWLNEYLFVEKLYGEYGSENWYKKEYYATSAQ